MDIGFEVDPTTFALQRASLGRLFAEPPATFGTAPWWWGSIGLSAEQCVDYHAGDLIDLLDGLVFDGHQVGIGQICQFATLGQLFDN